MPVFVDTLCPLMTEVAKRFVGHQLPISAGIAFNGLGQVNFSGTVSAVGKSMPGTYSGASGGNWKATR